MAKKPNTSITAISKNQRDAYNAMTPAGKEKAKEALEINWKITEGDVLAKYELGKVCKTMFGDKAKYGENSMTQLAKVLNKDASLLYACRMFASIYTKERIQTLLKTSAKAGFEFSWNHFKALCCKDMVGEKPALQRFREELERVAIAKRLPAGELVARIQAKAGGKRGKGGRPPAKPRSITAGVNEIADFTLRFNNKFAGWDEVVFEGATNAADDQVTDELVARLDAGQEAAEHLADQAAKAAAKLASARRRCGRVLQMRKDEEADTPDVPVRTAASKKTAKKPTASPVASKAAARPAKKKRQRRPIPAASKSAKPGKKKKAVKAAAKPAKPVKKKKTVKGSAADRAARAAKKRRAMQPS